MKIMYFLQSLRAAVFLTFTVFFTAVFSSCNVTGENFWSGDTNVNARFSGLLDLSKNNSDIASFKKISGSYKVLVITDIHEGAHFYRDSSESSFLDWLDNYSDKAQIKFCLGLGDFADSAKESEMKAYAELVSKIEQKLNGIKVLNVVGNHDLYASDGYELYKKYCYPNTSYYKFETGNMVWYALDSGSGTLGSLQRKSLISNIQDETKTPVVFSHMPLSKNDCGQFWLPFCFRDTTERSILLKVFSEKKIAGYFCGHYHPGGNDTFGNFTQYNLKSFGAYGKWYILDVDESSGSIITHQYPN